MTAGADLVLALTTGLVGGLGHCVGMCGPIVGALAISAAPALGPRRSALGQLAYNAGRVTTYSLLGGAMGLAGSFVNVAGRLAGLQDAVAVVAGLLMVVMGLAAAGVASWARGLEARAGGWLIAPAARLLRDGGAGRFYPLGLLLGLLPCGLSSWAFLGAAATGAPVPGFLFALCFALGTVPALLLAGSAAALLGARLRGALYRAGGVLMILLGALFAARGLGFHAL